METKPQRLAQEPKQSPENFIKDVRRKRRKFYSSAQRILIIMKALRGKIPWPPFADGHGIVESLFYRWNKEFLEAGKKKVAGASSMKARVNPATDLTMKNGTLVMKDGTVKMKSGKTSMMKDGGRIYMDGKMSKMKTDKMNSKM